MLIFILKRPADLYRLIVIASCSTVTIVTINDLR
jgi:hypothetical protein